MCNKWDNRWLMANCWRIIVEIAFMYMGKFDVVSVNGVCMSFVAKRSQAVCERPTRDPSNCTDSATYELTEPEFEPKP